MFKNLKDILGDANGPDKLNKDKSDVSIIFKNKSKDVNYYFFIIITFYRLKLFIK